MSISVTAFPRLHITLIDMAGCTSFAPGGIGFSINAFPTEIRVSTSGQLELIGFDRCDPPTHDDLTRVCRDLEKRANGCTARFELLRSADQHVGLGSKTTLLLAAITAFADLYSLNLNKQDIQRISGRGGLSGVGIHAFFEGGIILDAGCPISGEWRPRPSSSGSPSVLPLRVNRLPFPSNWAVFLIRPKAPSLTRDDERCFFAAASPIHENDALRTLALVYHGLLPAFVSSNLSLLADTLYSINFSGFKKLEVDIYGDQVSRILLWLAKERIACGMSSIGPTIYVIIDECDGRSMRTVTAAAELAGASVMGPFKGRNHGFERSELL